MSEGRFLVRRSPSLVSWWAGDAIVVHNYATGSTYRGSPLAAAILGTASRWTTGAEISRNLAYADSSDIAVVMDGLIAAGALRRLDAAAPDEERAIEGLNGWNPAAGFYHMATRNVEFAERGNEPFVSLRPVAPPPPKRYKNAASVELPDYPITGVLPEVLLARRTWRQFGAGSVTLQQFATLLGLTWGVQRWIQLDQNYRVALTTSPSGGALHSIEAYAVVFNVDGIEAGVYHYNGDAHRLERLCGAVPRGDLPSMLPTQRGFYDACVIVFLTSNFMRVHWKYPHPRAYRVVLLEAGHCAQTFCLLATWLGLAPFSTAALGDSAVERVLGIDGIRESVLYAVGIGTRPPGVDWAPDHDSLRAPETTASEFAACRAARNEV